MSLHTLFQRISHQEDLKHGPIKGQKSTGAQKSYAAFRSARSFERKEEIIPRPQADPDGPVSFASTAVLMHDWKASCTPFSQTRIHFMKCR
jgi:hypothetical protein